MKEQITSYGMHLKPATAANYNHKRNCNSTGPVSDLQPRRRATAPPLPTHAKDQPWTTHSQMTNVTKYYNNSWI